MKMTLTRAIICGCIIAIIAYLVQILFPVSPLKTSLIIGSWAFGVIAWIAWIKNP
jgi:hypothetical protein